MQNNTKTIILQSIIRGTITGIISILVFILGIWGLQVFAQNNKGGIFGEILNKILVKNWDTSNNDGTVKNSEKLGGLSANYYLKSKQGGQSCGENKCVVGFENDGTIICE